MLLWLANVRVVVMQFASICSTTSHLLCFLVIANYELLSIKTHTHTHTHALSQILTYFEATILDFCQNFKHIYKNSFDNKKSSRFHALARHKGNRPNEGRSQIVKILKMQISYLWPFLVMQVKKYGGENILQIMHVSSICGRCGFSSAIPDRGRFSFIIYYYYWEPMISNLQHGVCDFEDWVFDSEHEV